MVLLELQGLHLEATFCGVHSHLLGILLQSLWRNVTRTEQLFDICVIL